MSRPGTRRINRNPIPPMSGARREQIYRTQGRSGLNGCTSKQHRRWWHKANHATAVAERLRGAR